MSEILKDPDCAVGKHGNCKGEGWNVELDCLDVCPCLCHEKEIE